MKQILGNLGVKRNLYFIFYPLPLSKKNVYARLVCGMFEQQDEKFFGRVSGAETT